MLFLSSTSFSAKIAPILRMGTSGSRLVVHTRQLLRFLEAHAGGRGVKWTVVTVASEGESR